ncbi:hypothetical protein [Nitrosovibrio sp. Nv4]|uniref:hypothetical protein n=1 Tax=Nitrosovibrio sp. Nv4 TaxID=1945880 RepID=UPI000BC9A0D0|nr:hypothetical protein [Nitrosovibrio sp. Nv4]SOD41676.1 hypothetical protein SAMN06298226_1978 [Nitrosovibrio sp. Nv4]
MKTRRFLAIVSMVSILGFLASCAPMSPYEAVNSPTLRKTVQNARTRSDHDALTRHFENLAEEMRIKAAEQKKLLQHYEEKSYLYGRQAQDRQSHTWALMVRYEQAAKTSLSKAASHRQIAAQLEPDVYTSPDRQTAEAVDDTTNLRFGNN